MTDPYSPQPETPPEIRKLAMRTKGTRTTPLSIQRFIQVRLVEDEMVALDARGEENGEWEPADIVNYSQKNSLTIRQCGHIARQDPTRVIRQVAALRHIVKLHVDSRNYVYSDNGTPACVECGDDTVRWPCSTLRELASIWSDHPDYREEWRP